MKLTLTADPNSSRTFLLLAPPGIPLSSTFRRVTGDTERRRELMAEMQRLRGRVYLRDGAVTPDELTSDARHVQAIDDESWHLLILNAKNRVVGCTRYLQHSASTSYSRLRVRTAALARMEPWNERLRKAVEGELEDARRSGFSFVEIGGWALDESIRGSSDALRSVLFTYAWSQIIGGCLGLSTATHRNGSASILRRIGGRPLEWQGNALPPYYDPRYKCDMEVIRFDSRLPSAKYQYAIEEIRSEIPYMPVVTTSQPFRVWHTFVNRLHSPTGALLPWQPERVVPAA